MGNTPEFKMSDARHILLERRARLLKMRDKNRDAEQELVEVREPDWEDLSAEHTMASVLSRLGEAEVREIKQIDAALDRIDSDEYGTCSECGEPIRVERLKALPYTTTCVGCAD